MICNNIKTIFRSLLKNKAYGLLNIGGLAIGIAFSGLIFLWVGNELTYDRANVKKDRLYSVQVNMNFGGNEHTIGSTPRPMAAALKSEIPGITNTCRFSAEEQNALINIGDKSMYSGGKYADPSVFSMFTLPFVQGNAGSVFSELYSIVITEKTAVKFFGDEKNVIGKTIRMNNKQDYVVSGVLKDLPENSSLHFEWLTSYKTELKQHQLVYGHEDETDWNAYGP